MFVVIIDILQLDTTLLITKAIKLWASAQMMHDSYLYSTCILIAYTRKHCKLNHYERISDY